ncbi:TAXI family TRAP transporter solute-binding subunit [Peptoniphilus genitalis]
MSFRFCVRKIFQLIFHKLILFLKFAFFYEFISLPFSLKAEALIAKYPFYVNLHITPTEYKGQTDEISVVAVQSMLAVDERMADEDAYNIVKLLFENLDTMKESHARGGDIALDKALDGMSIEVHPGAQKYFDEVKK